MRGLVEDRRDYRWTLGSGKPPHRAALRTTIMDITHKSTIPLGASTINIFCNVSKLSLYGYALTWHDRLFPANTRTLSLRSVSAVFLFFLLINCANHQKVNLVNTLVTQMILTIEFGFCITILEYLKLSTSHACHASATSQWEL